jgi:TetR/AcrR family transcriptional regulator, transcriptional repressor for nem operon
VTAASSGKNEPKTAKARATRERLLRVAAQLFSVKGYFHTTVEDVMGEAALTKGGFYAHFESKEDLAYAAVEHATELWAQKVITHVMAFSDPREQLRELLEGYRRYAVDRTFEGGCFFVNLAVEMDDQHDEIRRLVEARFEQFRALVVTIVEGGKAAGVFRQDAPTRAIAALVVAALTGSMMLSKSAQKFDQFDDANDLLARLLATFET